MSSRFFSSPRRFLPRQRSPESLKRQVWRARLQSRDVKSHLAFQKLSGISASTPASSARKPRAQVHWNALKSQSATPCLLGHYDEIMKDILPSVSAPRNPKNH